MEISSITSFQRALAVLVALQGKGLKFKIQLPEGAEYGDLEVVQEGKPKKQHSKLRKRGTLSKIIDPHLITVGPGDAVQLPTPMLPDLTIEQYRGAVANRCSMMWGKGSFCTSIVGDLVEVLRLR